MPSAAPFHIDRSMEMMNAVPLAAEPGHTEYRQTVGPRFHDHRGLTILGSMGVLVDSVPGSAVSRSLPATVRTMLSQVSVTMGAPLPDRGELVARGRAVHIDIDTDTDTDTGGVGASVGEVTAPDGQVCAVVTSRSVVVTRAAAAEIGADREPVQVPDTERHTDPAEFADVAGVDVVAAIATGRIARGPLAGLYGLDVTDVEHGRVVTRFTPLPWMANYVGTVQGGNLIAVSDVTSGLAAQTLTAPGQQYRTLDMRIEFLRSPGLDGAPVEVRSEVVRAGRRIALIDTEMVDDSGILLTRSRASVQLR